MIIPTRRHQTHNTNREAWLRAKSAYAGGKNYINIALVRHVSEIAEEFEERKNRAYYINYPRAIARRITQYGMAVDPVRDNVDQELLQDWNRSGLCANESMRQLSTILNVYGRAWLLVDTPYFSGNVTMEQRKKEKLRPFVHVLDPLKVHDWHTGNDGQLDWAIVEFEYVEKTSPYIQESNETYVKLWTRDRWEVYRTRDISTTPIISGANACGRVPLVEVVEPDGFGMDTSHWFEDVVHISDAMLNNESEAQMNIVKQMFGMLVVSDAFARSARRSEESNPKNNQPSSFSGVVARSAALIETTEEKGISRYISPSGVTTATIIECNAQLKRQLYDIVGLACQSRNKEAQTAESKEWDFQDVAQFLRNRADLLEHAEIKAWELINAWDKSIIVPTITYNREFRIKDLQSSIQALLNVSSMPYVGNELSKQLLRSAVEVIESVAPIPDDNKRAILDEINRTQIAPMAEIF